MTQAPKAGRTSALGGAGCGVAVVTASQHLPEAIGWLQPWLAYAAPIISVAASVLWGQALRWWEDRQLDRLASKVQAISARIQADPTRTQAQKKEAAKLAANLDLARMRRLVNAAERISTDVEVIRSAAWSSSGSDQRG